MQIVKPHIVNIASNFWKKAGLGKTQPVDIKGAVYLTLPVDVVDDIPELSLRKIEKWLIQRNIPISIDIDDREIHGFILTANSCGFIFINATDPEEERRYTLAHELSHFILDYKIPRDRAIGKLGTAILEVLDGHREPSLAERIDGVLTAIEIKPYTHLLEKKGDGSFESMRVFEAETEADMLALELIAPCAKVVKAAKNGKSKPAFSEFRSNCHKVLKETYGLPGSIIEEYASRIAYATTGGPSLLTKLGY
ncbi:ImmA/IrrE family metallo-endopeptidase [Daejeonella sp. JGW-45]|uniref:ImmA/IrrE family metallo-endopeptidase n=1 Tax=Daejeonella sp. JGW-45 TaxID=3034148 RepID=UPI0023EC7101|nr:ImmA/IrrE family metallo-endopeptidase [Daejeonella sp. JGW-45]